MAKVSAAVKHIEQAEDLINHPSHYQSLVDGGPECIDAIRAALGADGFIAFLRGVVIAYTWRCGRKGHAVEDAEKAKWYQDRLVEELQV